MDKRDKIDMENSKEVNMSKVQRIPDWFTIFKDKARTTGVNSFVLYYNVWDDHLVDGGFLGMDELISRKEPGSRAAIVCFFDFEEGLRFADEEEGEKYPSPMTELFLRLLWGNARNADIKDSKKQFTEEFAEALHAFEEQKNSAARVLRWLSRLLRFGWEDVLKDDDESFGKVQKLLVEYGRKKGFLAASPKSAEDSLESNCKTLGSVHQSDPFALVVIEVPKLLVPSSTGSGGGSPMEDRIALDTFTAWARKKGIREKRNIITYLAEALSDIPEELRKGVRGFYPIKVDAPSETELREGIASMRLQYRAKKGDIGDEQLAFLCRGLEFKVVRRILAESYASGAALSAELVFDQKSRNIVEQTGGLLRLVRHTGHTYDMLGGLDYIVEDLRTMVQMIKAQKWDLIPRGKLYMGRRGTGKSETIKVVAAQAGIPVFEFGNMRNMYVGESERRLELALMKIRDNAPGFVIQDEIDAFWQRRGSIGDNTGVNQRMMGMMLDFLGDETVKGVVWFGLTNFPQALDPAFIRSGRFDEKWLFTVPDLKKRPAVIGAILRQLEAEVPQEGGGKFEYNLSDEDIATIAAKMDYQIVDGKVVPGGATKSRIDRKVYSLNGAEIKKVLKSARKRAFKSGENILRLQHVLDEVDQTLPEYTIDDQEMEEIALGFINNLEQLPEELRDEARKFKARQLERDSRRSPPDFPGGQMLNS